MEIQIRQSRVFDRHGKPALCEAVCSLQRAQLDVRRIQETYETMLTDWQMRHMRYASFEQGSLIWSHGGPDHIRDTATRRHGIWKKRLGSRYGMDQHPQKRQTAGRRCHADDDRASNFELCGSLKLQRILPSAKRRNTESP